MFRYAKEKAELDEVEARLAVVEGEKQVIVEEQRREEARVGRHMNILSIIMLLCYNVYNNVIMFIMLQ